MRKNVKKSIQIVLCSLLTLALLLGGMPFAFAAEDDGLTIVRIEAFDVTVMEGEDLTGEEVYDEETGQLTWVTRYAYEPDFIAYFSDGSSEEGEGGYFYIGDEYYDVNVYDTQDEEPWGVGEHTATVEVAGVTAEFTVTVEESPAQSLFVEDMVISETEVMTEYDEFGGSWTYYHILPESFSLTLKDGTVLEGMTFDGVAYVEYGDDWFLMEIEDDQTRENNWEPGSVHTVTATLMGVSTTFTVSISELLIQSVTVDDASCYAYSGGVYVPLTEKVKPSPEDYVFLYTEYLESLHYTVALSDGTVVESDEDGNVEINGVTMALSVDDDQYDTPWEVGGHTADVSLGKFQGSMKVTVLPCPVTRVQFAPFELTEGVDSVLLYDEYYDEDKDEIVTGEPYHFYRYTPYFDAYFADETAFSAYGSNIIYGDTFFPIEYLDDQTPDKAWEPGFHTVTALCCGEVYTIDVQILENPVERIEADDLTVLDTNFDFETEFDDYGETYYKCYAYTPSYRVILKDGTVLNGLADRVEYKDRMYDITLEDGQEPGSEWEPGGTYTVTLSVFEKSADFTVTLVPSPIESVAFDDVTVSENTHCSVYYELFSGEQWTCYEVVPTCTVTLSDGSTQIIKAGESFDYMGQSYFTEQIDEQGPDEQWGVGEHEATAMLAGNTGSYTVTITESDIVDAQITKVETYDINSQYIIPAFEFTLTHEDGSTESFAFDLTPDCDGAEYINGFSFIDFDMSYTVGVEKTMTVYIAGFERTLRFVPVGEQEPVYITGDVNGDGVVDVTDATLVQQYSAALIGFNDRQSQAADVNFDGVIDVTDATLIQEFSAGLIAAF